MVTAFEKVYGHTVEKVEVDPRPGDVAGAYANADTALRLLNWKAEMTLEQGISDALKWGDLRKERLGYE
jgi:UDP-glucose 4-epimerase